MIDPVLLEVRVRDAAQFMHHNGLCAALGGYGYCSCGMETARAELLAAAEALTSDKVDVSGYAELRDAPEIEQLPVRAVEPFRQALENLQAALTEIKKAATFAAAMAGEDEGKPYAAIAARAERALAAANGDETQGEQPSIAADSGAGR